MKNLNKMPSHPDKTLTHPDFWQLELVLPLLKNPGNSTTNTNWAIANKSENLQLKFVKWGSKNRMCPDLNGQQVSGCEMVEF